MRYTDTPEYNNLRLEYNKTSFREIMRDNLGSRCYNCGSVESVEYHHIVPLMLGGTNSLRNIVPLCSRCHKAAHNGRHMSQYRNSGHDGRPMKVPLTPETEKILWDWANGKIGSRECKETLGYGRASKVKETALYREFIKKHGIQNIRNTRDIVVANGQLVEGKQVSTIYYMDGEREFGYYNPSD